MAFPLRSPSSAARSKAQCASRRWNDRRFKGFVSYWTIWKSNLKHQGLENVWTYLRVENDWADSVCSHEHILPTMYLRCFKGLLKPFPLPCFFLQSKLLRQRFRTSHSQKLKQEKIYQAESTRANCQTNKHTDTPLLFRRTAAGVPQWAARARRTRGYWVPLHAVDQKDLNKKPKRTLSDKYDKYDKWNTLNLRAFQQTCLTKHVKHRYPAKKWQEPGPGSNNFWTPETSSDDLRRPPGTLSHLSFGLFVLCIFWVFHVFLRVLEEATGPLDFPPAPASAPEERRKRANPGHEVQKSTRHKRNQKRNDLTWRSLTSHQTHTRLIPIPSQPNMLSEPLAGATLLF